MANFAKLPTWRTSSISTRLSKHRARPLGGGSGDTSRPEQKEHKPPPDDPYAKSGFGTTRRF